MNDIHDRKPESVMINFNKWVILIVLLALSSGCQQLKQMEINDKCSKSKAYSAGVNDGKDNKDMASDYASICPKDKRKSYNKAYRQGYQFGLKQYAKKAPKNDGQHTSEWGCMTSFTQKICGYDCTKGIGEKVYCGKTKHDQCIKDSSGNVKCGLHCRTKKYGPGIKCQKQSYSKDSARPSN
jgi:hypothetical protein